MLPKIQIQMPRLHNKFDIKKMLWEHLSARFEPELQAIRKLNLECHAQGLGDLPAMKMLDRPKRFELAETQRGVEWFQRPPFGHMLVSGIDKNGILNMVTEDQVEKMIKEARQYAAEDKQVK